MQQSCFYFNLVYTCSILHGWNFDLIGSALPSKQTAQLFAPFFCLYFSHITHSYILVHVQFYHGYIFCIQMDAHRKFKFSSLFYCWINNFELLSSLSSWWSESLLCVCTISFNWSGWQLCNSITMCMTEYIHVSGIVL